MAFLTQPPEALLSPLVQTPNAEAIFVDASPRASAETSLLVYNMRAVWGMVNNLLSSYRNANIRVFNKAYCNLYEMLQEPYEPNTATKIELGIRQGIQKYIPVVTSINRLTVANDDSIPGYYVFMDLTAGITRGTNQFLIRM